MKKTIHIKTAEKQMIDNQQARLSFSIDFVNTDNNSIDNDCLWYETDAEYFDCLCSEKADGVIVNLLPYAIRYGYDIVSDVAVSEKLYYNLTHQVIPQLCVCNNKGIITIKAPIDNTPFASTAAVSGMSCGVDSFATLYEYTEDCNLDAYRITHLTFFENGAHHSGAGEDFVLMKKVFQGQLDVARRFCEKHNFKLLAMFSNLNSFLFDHFGLDAYDKTHTYRNIGMAMLLQKLIRNYYYSSTYNVDHFVCDMNKDSAMYEKYLLPHLATDSFSAYSSNKSMTRFEKTQYVSQFESSYDYLNVCYMTGENCGKCKKCVRTMLTLDIIGQLEKYRNRFDVDYFNKNKDWYYTNLYYRRRDDFYTNEIYENVKRLGIKIPFRCKFKGTMLYFTKKIFAKIKKIKLIRKIGYKYKPY